MKLTPKAHEVAARILDAFRSGAVPKALAATFLARHHDSPCRRWSWHNRLAIALHGHADARGFRQWQKVGRHVRPGEHALHILVPMLVQRRHRPRRPAENPDVEPRQKRIGFRSIPVFGYDQTEGEPLPGSEGAPHLLETLPLLEVAHHWGLLVKEQLPGGRLGYCRAGVEIGLAVEDLAPWAQDFVHAADDRLRAHNRPGQKLDNKVVAELGAAILLECLGYTARSDRGGAYEYIDHYCRDYSRDPLQICSQLLDRTCAAVELIL